MDPYTQHLLEKAEQRSRAHGINSNFSLTQCALLSIPPAVASASQSQPQTESRPQPQTQMHSQQQHIEHANSNTIGNVGNIVNKLQVVEKNTSKNGDHANNDVTTSPSKKVMRHFSAVDKENLDLGIEINILTDKNVEVQVQVEEQNVTDSENDWQNANAGKPLAQLRDTSRNHLQRLGTLYSNTTDLSSPIHRTEGKFHAELDNANFEQQNRRKPKQGLDKLAALAQTINQWEDDGVITHHSVGTSAVSNAAPPKPALPSRKTLLAEENKKKLEANEEKRNEKPCDAAAVENRDGRKQLKWDSKVLHTLEAQGFQRIDSSDVKLSYDFAVQAKNSKAEVESTTAPTELEDGKRQIGKLSSSKYAALAHSNIPDDDKRNKLKNTNETAAVAVKPGLVSGRAAVFETKTHTNKADPPKTQKDPTELSLKERMKLFERNKGEALLPKAAFGMAAPISKILQDGHNKAKEEAATASSSQSNCTPLVRLQKENKLRDKVIALVNATNDNRIRQDIRKQREEDLQLIANRYNYQKKEIFEGKRMDVTATENTQNEKKSPTKLMNTHSKHNKQRIPTPPPPPPPPPTTAAIISNFNTLAKRRSSSNVEDEEKKRARKTNEQQQQEKYQYCHQQPLAVAGKADALSDAYTNDTNSDNEDNLCSTATLSALTSADEVASSTVQATAGCRDAFNDSDEDSYSMAENKFLYAKHDDQNTRIVQMDKKINSKAKHVRYAMDEPYASKHSPSIMRDSDMNSSATSIGLNDYLEEALGSTEGDIDMTDEDDIISQEKENFVNCDNETSQESQGSAQSHSFTFTRTHSSKQYDVCATPFGRANDNKDDSSPSKVKQRRADMDAMPTSTSKQQQHDYALQPVKSQLSINKDDDNTVTLVHTVSFYRRQQNNNSASSTPIRRISREEQVLRSNLKEINNDAATPKSTNQDKLTRIHYEESDEEEMTDSSLNDESEKALVKKKIENLLAEVCKQQQIIIQTSQALNLCAATVEFSGSAESVEGERHLLVASHRRQALLNEIQRLGIEQTIRPLNAPKERGCLTVLDIIIPLRQDYIRKVAADTISGHHLLCLLKYNEHVLATKTVPTLPGLLAVKFPDVLELSDVYADFKVTVEIYGMTAQREILPHEVKYHINVNKKSSAVKKKNIDNRLVMPPVQSPGGPQVVRTPALVQYAYAIFSLREIQRTTWSLTHVSGVSPLDGVLHMKINCELSVSVEYKAFLTMFEDISGFGAWHRRWCHLKGTVLNYWKYPDDEKKKAPMGSIDLYTCTSQKVCTAPRDVCARLNTMLLECQRPARDTDTESLIIIPNGRTTIVRYLLSADTKEEREEWCSHFNKTLTLLRAWGPPQY